jgi:protoporphyrinogen oxidase
MTQQNQQASIGIVGGGIGGVTLAYRLAKAGHRVTVYERTENLGGLATFLEYNGARVDRYYHTILSSDMSMQTLIQEAGVGDKLHFKETKQGFYDNGKLYPFNTPIDFMLFPPLNLFQRIRLALQIIVAQFEKDRDKMDKLPVIDWLMRVSGRGVVEKVWKPLLRAKFDSESVNIPATYIWSRLRRMMSTRQGATSKEMMCYLEGGYYTLIEALAKAAEKLGVQFHLNTAIDEIVIEDNRVIGLKVNGETRPYDAVISTLQSNVFGRLIPNAPHEFREAMLDQGYLGVLSPILLCKQALSPYYVLNITDDSIPFTAVVETTALIDPQHVGGYHLVYLPKYLPQDSALWGWSDQQVQTEWMKHFRKMFPDYDVNNIEAFLVQRPRLVEPLVPMEKTNNIPSIKTPVTGLYMSNSVMVYPDLNNGESITRLAARTVETVLSDWQAGRLSAVDHATAMQ